MKDWHLEHAEKVIVRFVKGLSPDASAFEKRNYKKYGTVTHCIKQIQYDMQHGVEKMEVMEILRKIRLHKKYEELRLVVEAMQRLEDLEDRLSGTNKVENLLWYDRAYKDRR